MLPDRVSNPRPLIYESGALPIALRGPARTEWDGCDNLHSIGYIGLPEHVMWYTCRKEFVPSEAFPLLF